MPIGEILTFCPGYDATLSLKHVCGVGGWCLFVWPNAGTFLMGRRQFCHACLLRYYTGMGTIAVTHTSPSVKFSNFQCRFVHILQEGDLLVCPVIVIRDLDHYCFAIHSIVVPKSLVEMFETLCISYVNMNKTFYKPSLSLSLYL